MQYKPEKGDGTNIEMVALFDRFNRSSTAVDIIKRIPTQPYLIVFTTVIIISVFLFIFTVLDDVGESYIDAMIYFPFYALTLFKIVDIFFMYKIVDLLECLSFADSMKVFFAVLLECAVVILAPLAILFQENGHLQSHYEMFVNAATFVVLFHDQYFIFSVALLYSQIRVKCTPFKRHASLLDDSIVIVDLESKQLTIDELSALNKFKNKIQPYVYSRFRLFSVCFMMSSAVVVYLGHQSNLNNFGVINFALCSMMFLSTSWLINRVNATFTKLESVYEIDLKALKLRVLSTDNDHILTYSIACTLVVTVFHLLFGSDL